MKFRKQRRTRSSSAPRRPDTIQSVSGYKLRVQRLTKDKVKVSFLDPNNRLLHRATFKREDWESIR